MKTSSRLIVVSNRTAGDRVPAGGLVFALHECLSKQDGVWVGSAEETVDDPAEQLVHHPGEIYDRYLFEMTETEHEQFYLGHANSVLWPLCHGRKELMEMSAENYRGYRTVNARLAAQLKAIMKPDDVIWVHDYHFLPLAFELRALGVENRIGFFLHIPFPAGHDLTALSDWQDVLEWFAAFDLVGLQSQRDVSQMIGAVRNHPKAELLLNGMVRINSQQVAVRAFPIGIDAETFRKEAEAESDAALITLRPHEKLVIGVDRLDYSKGLPQRFDGFAAYLDNRQEGDPEATLLQIAPPSRGDVAAYQDIRAELEQKSGAVNGGHASLDWTPIRYISQHVERERLAQLYRRADVGLVTPLIDGMNLVAKEYIAAQDPEDPGVLVLSSMAGAAEQMEDALLINPYDPDDIGAALRIALTMPLDERKARYESLAQVVFDKDVFWWTDQVMQYLIRPKEETVRWMRDLPMTEVDQVG